MKTKTIVLVHGMYMTPLCWEHWIDYFQAKGYKCLAPAWPGRDQPVDNLRKDHPFQQTSQLTLNRILDNLADTIRTLNEKPVLIGHSMGGLAVQMLLQKGLAAAGVAIDSAPPKGIFTTKWSFLNPIGRILLLLFHKTAQSKCLLSAFNTPSSIHYPLQNNKAHTKGMSYLNLAMSLARH